ncbi:hypothetical protein [uncultured Gilvimarinus sp.]|uniref:hypothetical protein n=1 Tax=uncultured Gilvimarinus sp. TaxID=1689143 RepID=UPI0030EF6099|tara:strand:- start:6884 stop:7483 length:600 start_codon:yes stop_codon:yes gene_type:complete
MLDENTARLNEYEAQQFHADKRAEWLGRDEANVTAQVELVEVCTARLLFQRKETQVGLRIARHGDILGECLEDGRLRKAMREWREIGDTTLVDNVIWRAAARIVTETFSFSIKELGLVATTYPNMSQAEKAGYEVPLSAHIDSMIKREIPTEIYNIRADIAGKKQLVTGRGKTQAEAQQNALALIERLTESAHKQEVAA